MGRPAVIYEGVLPVIHWDTSIAAMKEAVLVYKERPGAGGRKLCWLLFTGRSGDAMKEAVLAVIHREIRRGDAGSCASCYSLLLLFTGTPGAAMKEAVLLFTWRPGAAMNEAVLLFTGTPGAAMKEAVLAGIHWNTRSGDEGSRPVIHWGGTI